MPALTVPVVTLIEGRADLANRAASVVIQILHMMFVGTTLHSLQPFDCVEYAPAVIDSPHTEVLVVMDRYPKIKCKYAEEEYFRMAVTGIVGFIVYTCLYFLFVLYTLYKVRTLSVLHKDYVPDSRPKRKKRSSDQNSPEKIVPTSEEIPAELEVTNADSTEAESPRPAATVGSTGQAVVESTTATTVRLHV